MRLNQGLQYTSLGTGLASSSYNTGLHRCEQKRVPNRTIARKGQLKFAHIRIYFMAFVREGKAQAIRSVTTSVRERKAQASQLDVNACTLSSQKVIILFQYNPYR